LERIPNGDAAFDYLSVLKLQGNTRRLPGALTASRVPRLEHFRIQRIGPGPVDDEPRGQTAHFVGRFPACALQPTSHTMRGSSAKSMNGKPVTVCVVQQGFRIQIIEVERRNHLSQQGASVMFDGRRHRLAEPA
jgi:hypothetical protein